MDMDMNMNMSASSHMIMTFFTATDTPLYSYGWTPSGAGSYAGTCIFLIILTVIYRSLFAVKAALENKWLDKAWNRRYVVVADKAPEAERVKADPDAKTAVLTANGVEENVKVVHRATRGVQPWRFSVDLPRAALVTVMVGVGYLLMLAIMTMNLGYFLSILAGSFVGELAVGRYIQVEDHH